MTLTTDAAKRKAAPVFSGVLRYFPDALMEVARVSKAGNDQHNPGEPLHWAKEKSSDEGDALVRHQLEAGTFDTDGMRHSAKVAWRALAQLQREIDAESAGEETYKAIMEAQQAGRVTHFCYKWNCLGHTDPNAYCLTGEKKRRGHRD